VSSSQFLSLAAVNSALYNKCTVRMFAVWLTGMKQMFSQGMADVLLDACSDFWDGRDIRPLGSEER